MNTSSVLTFPSRVVLYLRWCQYVHTTYLVHQYKYVQTGRWQGSVAAWVHECCVPGTPSLWMCKYYFLWVRTPHLVVPFTPQHVHRRAQRVQRCRDLNSWSTWLRDCWRISTYFFQVTNKLLRRTNQDKCFCAVRKCVRERRITDTTFDRTWCRVHHACAPLGTSRALVSRDCTAAS